MASPVQRYLALSVPPVPVFNTVLVSRLVRVECHKDSILGGSSTRSTWGFRFLTRFLPGTRARFPVLEGVAEGSVCKESTLRFQLSIDAGHAAFRAACLVIHITLFLRLCPGLSLSSESPTLDRVQIDRQRAFRKTKNERVLPQTAQTKTRKKQFR